MARAQKVPLVRALQCPNCGGPVELKGYAQTINAVCIQCLSILDARTPSLRVLQQFQARERRIPLIPLGTRGKFEGAEFECIGFQVRSITVDGEVYEWSEYLLLNPYKGYRYLTEYTGHWNFIRTMHAVPAPSSAGRKSAVIVNGKRFTHFQTARAQTAYVMGQFPWQVRVGESVDAADYIYPPEVVSSETTAEEVTWSHGVYTPGAEIWRAFALPGSPPRAVGVYSNQPSPHTGRVASAWGVLLVLLTIWFVAVVWTFLISPNDRVFEQRYTFDAAVAGERSFVTEMFDLKGRESNVEIEISTDLENDWAYFGLALINDTTGVAYDTGREISYYTGRDSEGAWTEGNRSGRVTIPNVPAGRYYLRVEPEMDDDRLRFHGVRYSIEVTRGVPSFGWFLFALPLLLIPPIYITARAFSFENRRWAESDYGAMISSSSSED